MGIAAVGGTEWLIFMVNGLVIGLVEGFSILLGNRFGEKNEEDFGFYYKMSTRICTHTSHTKNRHIIGSYATLGI